MELEIKDEEDFSIKTIKKKEKTKVYFTINKLTSSLPLTTDQIFKIFINNNIDILEKLTENNQNIIEKDIHCKCFSMRKRKNYYNKKCKGCQIISRLIKTNFLTSNTIEIFTGKNKNMELSIESSLLCKNISYRISKNACQIFKYFSNAIRNQESYIDDVKYFFTENDNYNYLINSIIMNYNLKQEKLPLYNNFLWGFLCNCTFTIIKKNSVFKNLDELCNSPYYSNYSSPILSSQERKISINTVEMILKQLCLLLKTMSKYYFIHGDPCIRYISYTSEKINIREETFPLKIVLDPSFCSSQNFKNKRYFHSPENKFFNFGVPFEKIDVHINGSKSYFIHLNIMSNYDELSILYYKIGNKSNIFKKMRNNYSIPVCYKSFDFICFLVSFMANDLFFKTFKESDHLLKIWRLLWKTDEYSLIMKDITDIEYNTFESIFSIVKKYHIRFDALDYFYQEIFK